MYKETYQGPLNQEQLLKDETIFHVANGYIGKKGVFTEGYGYPHKRGVFLNGFYNTYDFHYEENAQQFPQQGKTIMALPDASLITFKVNGCGINQKEMTHLLTERSFDLEKGMTLRTTTYQSPNGEVYQLKEVIYAHQHAYSVVKIEIHLKALTKDATCECHHYVSMPLINASNTRDPRVAYERTHLQMTHIDLNKKQYHFETQSKQFQGNLEFMMNENFHYRIEQEDVIGTFNHMLKKDEAFTLELTLKYHSNHIQLENNDTSLFSHLKILETYWKHYPLIFADPKKQEVMDYHMYQLYHAGGMHPRLSIAAKGLSGEGYEGHYFWDTEIYMLPYFIYHYPDKAKTLLQHRMLFIEEARYEALQLHVNKGIKIPWRSIDGTEISPYFLAGSAQLHINSDIAYAIILYNETTGDVSLFNEGGFRFLVELALYILHYGFFDGHSFHLMQVTGPDEYTTLVDDNYYTNRLAAFHFNYILKHVSKYRHLVQDLFSEEDMHLMKQATENMHFNYDESLQLYLQDASHHLRKPLDKKILPNEGLPLILKYHPQFIYRHQVLKQADSVAADILLNRHDEAFKKGFYYYLKMTSHDSSLSKCIYGIGAFQLGETDLAHQFFEDTLRLDLEDLKKHTKNGLHMANIGGSYLMILKGIFGVHSMDGLSVAPTMIEQSHGISIQFLYQGIAVKMSLYEATFQIEVSQPLNIRVYDIVHSIESIQTFNKRKQ